LRVQTLSKAESANGKEDGKARAGARGAEAAVAAVAVEGTGMAAAAGTTGKIAASAATEVKTDRKRERATFVPEVIKKNLPYCICEIMRLTAGRRRAAALWSL
jgi:hypothetical protein